MTRLRLTALYIVASPILLLMIVFDIVKFPVLIFFSPLWLLMDVIDVLKGDRSQFWEFFKDFATIGYQICRDDILNQD